MTAKRSPRFRIPKKFPMDSLFTSPPDQVGCEVLRWWCVCLSVCPLAYLKKPLVQTLWNFLYALPVTTARFATIQYVFSVLCNCGWHRFAHSGPYGACLIGNRAYTQSYSPEGRTGAKFDVHDCTVIAWGGLQNSNRTIFPRQCRKIFPFTREVLRRLFSAAREPCNVIFYPGGIPAHSAGFPSSPSTRSTVVCGSWYLMIF